MIANNGQFTGNITGSIITGGKLIGTYIEGGSINIGDDLFTADDSDVFLGDFCVLSGKRGQFSSSNQKVGMMSSARGTDQAWLWAGANNEPYPFVVNGNGETRIGKIANSEYWSGYSLSEALDYIWKNNKDCGLIDLANRINYLEKHAVLK